jgi:hypothetical protein
MLEGGRRSAAKRAIDELQRPPPFLVASHLFSHSQQSHCSRPPHRHAALQHTHRGGGSAPALCVLDSPLPRPAPALLPPPAPSLRC